MTPGDTCVDEKGDTEILGILEFILFEKDRIP